MTLGRAAAVAGARRVVYRTLAAVLLPPEEERLATLVIAAPELRRLTEPLEGSEPFPAWLEFVDRLAAFGQNDLERAGRDHTMLFQSGSPDRSVPPYESSHIAVPEFGQAMVSAQVETCYRAAGLVMADVARGELPDHVAVELEFLAFLCGQEASAEEEMAARWRAEQRSFLEGHLLRWLGTFEARLKEVAPGSEPTRATSVARAFAQHDILLLEALGTRAAS
jgi:TorA maturation chaperone TorD